MVTILSIIVAFPIAYYAARYARGRAKAAFYLAVMMPLWSSYLVKVYAWKLLLAKEGVIGWVMDAIGATPVLNAALGIPVIGGPSLSTSYIGMVLVFMYLWIPYMILPVQAALERVPVSLIEAAGDLGANPGQTFRGVILPLALPGVVAGAIFTFSLTLGDYIVPEIVGPSSLILGQVVYVQQGTAGNIPLAAAFSVVPIVVMGVLLTIAKRTGAFDAL
jgi:putative spermidine/putrescine transport system permease protein